MMNKGEIPYTYLALLFFNIFILNVVLAAIEGNPASSLWFCSTLVLVFAVGLFFRNNLLISSTLVSSFILEGLWTIDIISYLFTRKLVLGITTYLYDIGTLRLILTFYHVLLFAVPIIVILKIKRISTYAWLFSSVHLLILQVITFIATDTNVNCVHYTCDSGVFNWIYNLRPEYISNPIFEWLMATLFLFIPANIIFYWILKRFWHKKMPKFKYF